LTRSPRRLCRAAGSGVLPVPPWRRFGRAPFEGGAVRACRRFGRAAGSAVAPVRRGAGSTGPARAGRLCRAGELPRRRSCHPRQALASSPQDIGRRRRSSPRRYRPPPAKFTPRYRPPPTS